MTLAIVVGAHIQPNRVSAACARGDEVLASVSIPSPHSVSYERSVVDAVDRACTTAGVPVPELSRIVVGASLQSLLPTRLLRRVPSGHHWRTSLAVALEFRLPVTVRVQSALALIALAEARTGGTGDFVIIQAGRPVEVGISRDGHFESVGIIRAITSHCEPYARERLLGELTRLVRPLYRPGRVPVVVLHRHATYTGRVIDRQLPGKLVAQGLPRPGLRTTRVHGDAVIAGALLLANSEAAPSVSSTLPVKI